MKRVLITGATSAITAAKARKHAQQGARLYLLGGRSQDKLDKLVAELGPAVAGARTADFDHTDDNAAADAAAITALGGLDLAILAQGALGDQVASERSYGEAE